MVRQCAWCLRLIDSAGERVSPSPLPKLYEASHGICCVCGARWIEQAITTNDMQGFNQNLPVPPTRRSRISQKTAPDTDRLPKPPAMPMPPEKPAQPAIQESMTQLVLKLQQPAPNTETARKPRSGDTTRAPLKGKRSRIV